VITVGSCDAAVREALDRLACEGIELDYLRVRGFPFGSELETFLGQHTRIFVVEQNRDAQLKALLLLETTVDRDRLTSILHYGGMPIDSGSIIRAIRSAYAQGAAA
jgi:2-oxoglutarate ferredoxin oxidoreductase subunit alpha